MERRNGKKNGNRMDVRDKNGMDKMERIERKGTGREGEGVREIHERNGRRFFIFIFFFEISLTWTPSIFYLEQLF